MENQNDALIKMLCTDVMINRKTLFFNIIVTPKSLQSKAIKKLFLLRKLDN